MDPQYVYTKKRSEFGRQCFFADEGPKLMESILPNKQLHNDCVFKNPVNRSAECSNILAEHEVISQKYFQILILIEPLALKQYMNIR
jgi:dynein intermediate chain 2